MKRQQMKAPNELSDAELLRTFQRTDGQADNREVESLLSEIERRDLDL